MYVLVCLQMQHELIILTNVYYVYGIFNMYTAGGTLVLHIGLLGNLLYNKENNFIYFSSVVISVQQYFYYATKATGQKSTIF